MYAIFRSYASLLFNLQSLTECCSKAVRILQKHWHHDLTCLLVKVVLLVSNTPNGNANCETLFQGCE